MITPKELLKELVIALAVGLAIAGGVWYGIASSPLYGWL